MSPKLPTIIFAFQVLYFCTTNCHRLTVTCTVSLDWIEAVVYGTWWWEKTDVLLRLLDSFCSNWVFFPFILLIVWMDSLYVKSLSSPIYFRLYFFCWCLMETLNMHASNIAGLYYIIILLDFKVYVLNLDPLDWCYLTERSSICIVAKACARDLRNSL